MTLEDLNIAVYNRLFEEQLAFRDWLLTQSPQEVLNHAYEYSMREDILYALENFDLSLREASALLTAEKPLENIYKKYLGMETDHMEEITTSIEDFAQDIAVLCKETREQPIYQHNFEYARSHDEIGLYRNSYFANVACKEAIERAIRQNYAQNAMNPAAVTQVVEQFGFDRTLYVLANTVQIKDWDGRFSPKHKAWAKTIQIPDDGQSMLHYRLRCVVDQAHPGLTDLFIEMVHTEQREREKEKASIREMLKASKAAARKVTPVKKTKEEVR